MYGFSVSYTVRVNWRLLNEDASGEAQSGARNMAIDEALLREMREGDAPVLRFYRWNPPCLSLGRFQKCDDLSLGGISWVRRPTGGRAVWHQHEITYSFVLREELFAPDKCSIIETYRRISECFL